MTLTLTPGPSLSGVTSPRVRIEADAGAGGTFLSLSFRRDGVPSRAVPPVGVQATSVYDYEAPFGRSVTYTATGTYIPAGTPVWTESWADLTNWTGDTADWSVSGGEAQSSVGGSSIVRTTGGTIQRLVVTDPVAVTVEVLDGADVAVLTVETITGFGHTRISADGFSQSVYALGSYEVVVSNGTATATASDSSWSISVPAPSTGTKVRLVSVFPSPTSSVGTVAATLTQAESTYSESATVTLAETRAWLIHPTSPSLSVAIDPGPSVGWVGIPVGIGIDSAQETRHESPQSVFQPPGRARAVVFPLGPRRIGNWNLSLIAYEATSRDAILAMLSGSVPLLLRTPAFFECDLPDDWYAVGDVIQRRPSVALDNARLHEMRTLDLPLTPVDSPPVALAPEYSYGDVLVDYATYGDVLAAFPTYYALLKGEPA